MSNIVTEIVNGLAQVKVATMIAEAVGVAVPHALTNFEATASTALATLQPIEAPTSLSADLNDAVTVATAFTPLLKNMNLGNVVAAVQSIPATKANLESGQIAIIGVVGASFHGVSDEIVVAMYRKSGNFAKLVDQGVTDAANVTT
jgi:hypothetical protein